MRPAADEPPDYFFACELRNLCVTNQGENWQLQKENEFFQVVVSQNSGQFRSLANRVVVRIGLKFEVVCVFACVGNVRLS